MDGLGCGGEGVISGRVDDGDEGDGGFGIGVWMVMMMVVMGGGLEVKTWSAAHGWWW